MDKSDDTRIAEMLDLEDHFVPGVDVAVGAVAGGSSCQTKNQIRIPSITFAHVL